ncbi:hypothetical protein Fmac_020373 [Flemingia macrophylla]|uniref:C2 domain-containing protein n=1 Tax=Flemingia macrophylla TaxID=520843 RepID=A0ABD1LU18_9FABA
MLAIWMGTQVDEAFPEAWHSDSALIKGDGVYNIRSKVYVNPKLWYLRVNVIEAQDVEPNDKSQPPETPNPMWNEDLVFVEAEPFEEQLVLTVENKASLGKDEVVAKISLQLNKFEIRLDHRLVHSHWYNLESDTRPTARKLWKQPIGILEVGILSAQGLHSMKTINGKGSINAYCVAKYGQKWVRTRTIIESFNPKWNEQYTWEMYDPCTVITFGVFDNNHLGGSQQGSVDSRIGMVRIRLSTLEMDTLQENVQIATVMETILRRL